MIMCQESCNLNKIEIPEINQPVTDKSLQCCLVEWRLDGFSLVVVGLYRTPGSMDDNVFLSNLV